MRPTTSRRTLDLNGKVVFITGGGDGIGLATCRNLVAKGARVALVDRSEAAAQQAVRELGSDRALAITADVTDRAGMRQAAQTTVDHFGNLDIVIANAGITPPAGTFRVLDPADFDQVIAVNLTGVLNTVQPAIEALIEAKGHIVVVASCAAFSPPMGGASYMISKAAVEVMGRAFTLELAVHDVTVTTSYFGIVETHLTRAALDDDPLGPRIEALMPAPLRKRITAEHAADTIVDGIERRATRTVAPVAWQPLRVMRGMVAGPIDRYLSRSKKIHRLIRALEQNASTGE